MENNDIVNFSSFFDNQSAKLSKFNKEDFADLFLNEEKEKIEIEPEFDPPVDAEDFLIDEEEPEETDFEESLPTLQNKNTFNKVKGNKIQEEVEEDFEKELNKPGGFRERSSRW